MDPVRAIANAVLYEGYLLWPYTPSALKNQKRFTFGDVDPVERPVRRAQVLLEGDAPVSATVRWLDPGGAEHEAAMEPVIDRVGPGMRRVTVEVRSEGRVMHGTHVILHGGGFVSATEAQGCDNDGFWPVLVGEPGSRNAMLCSPIILEDHPRVAPESPGDLFDGGEIDGLLTLSIMALTDEEKEEIRAGDPRAREILERTEGLSREQLMTLLGGRLE